MNVGSILSALQSGAVIPSGVAKPVGIQLTEGTPITSFRETLTEQIRQQASVALHPQETGSTTASNYQGFAAQMVDDVQRLQSNATAATGKVLQGDGGSLHTAMIAMEEASVSFQLLVEMRNKVVETLQELMRMQV